MDVNRLCPKCMNETAGNICSHCGYDREKGQDNAHALKPLTILSGKYLIGNVIGEGGFGITYIGYDLNLEMKIAVKEFYPNGFVTRESKVTNEVTGYTTNDPAQYQKWKDSFIREARNLAKFSNLPGIVHVRDFFQENNTAYIVMEYVEGETLKDYLKKRTRPLSINETLDMMEPVIRSLSKVHAGGIIHRDISPDNIMIQDGGDIKLIDFGAAREFESGNEKSMSVLLKPGYAPEEQYRTKGDQGPWTDVYALSATIYRCITGIKPVESMERMRTDELKKPSEMGIQIQPGTENALLKGMAVYAEDRIRSMDELKQALYGNTYNAPGEEEKRTVTEVQDDSVSDKTLYSKDIIHQDSVKINKKMIGAVCGGILILLLVIIMITKGTGGNAKTEESVSEVTGAPAEEIMAVTEKAAEEDTSSEKKKKKKKDEDGDKKEYTEDKGIHRYDYIVADVTWEEAFRDAANRGGYLLHMNSDEEAAYIINEIQDRDLTGKSFFIGGGRKGDSDEYFWLDPDGEPFGSKLNDDAFSGYWLPGEPSFGSDGIEERYMDMIYRKSENRWYWNDIPNDLIQASSSFAGKVGYIIEYDDNAEGGSNESGNADVRLEDVLIGQWHCPLGTGADDFTFYENGTYLRESYDSVEADGEKYKVEGNNLSIYYPNNGWVNSDIDIIEWKGMKWVNLYPLFGSIFYSDNTDEYWYCKVEESSRHGVYSNGGSWISANHDMLWDNYPGNGERIYPGLYLPYIGGENNTYAVDTMFFGRSTLPDVQYGFEGWVEILLAAEDSWFFLPCDYDEDAGEITLYAAPEKKIKIEFQYIDDYSATVRCDDTEDIFKLYDE